MCSRISCFSIDEDVMSSSTYMSTLMIWERFDRPVVRVNPLPAKIDSAADSRVGGYLGFKLG